MDSVRKPELAIRADGNTEIGLGHIHRTLALADYLKDYFSITFFVFAADDLVSGIIKNKEYSLKHIAAPDYNNPEIFTEAISNNAIVVLDGYNFKTEYQKALKRIGCKVIAIDDLNEWENVADVVINHGYSGVGYKLAPGSEFYKGLKYAIIKPEILNSEKPGLKISNEHVLICIGGTDSEGYSEKIVNDLLNGTNKQVSLLTYPLNPSFNKLKKTAQENPDKLKLYHSLNTKEIIHLIAENDIAILQPSNIALEAAALGIYISLVKTADNQKHILETLINSSCGVELRTDSIAESINSITVEQINAQIRNQEGLFDGKSPLRILELVSSLLLDCRLVNEDDVKLIYEWNNDPVTRANSHNTAKIEYADHEKWFAERIINEKLDFLLFSYNKIPCGSVRIERKENENVIGIAIAPQFRGKKLATVILNKAGEYFYAKHGRKEIAAYIKKQNLPSIKSFERAGYKILSEGEYCGDRGYRLIKK